MKMLTWGVIPEDLEIEKPYQMRLNKSDLALVTGIVNQGIDSHLDAVITRQYRSSVWIVDSRSMRCFLRRCCESEKESLYALASGIMETLGYEWV